MKELSEDVLKGVMENAFNIAFDDILHELHKLLKSKPRVPEAFIKKWATKFWELCCSLSNDVVIEDKERCISGRLIQMFTEAGVEIESR